MNAFDPIREGRLTVMSDDPEPAIDHLWGMGFDVMASVNPESPQGRILSTMAPGTEAVIAVMPGFQTFTPLAHATGGTDRTNGTPDQPEGAQPIVDDANTNDEHDQTQQDDVQLTRRQILEDINRRADQYLHRQQQSAQEQERIIRQ